MLLQDASIISLKVWPQAVTSLWGWNWLSCISRVNNLEQYEIFLFLSLNALFDLWLKVRWPAWLHSLSEFHQKKKITFYLNDRGSRHHMIKAEEHLQYKKHYQTVQWSNSCLDAHCTPQSWFTSDVFVLLDLGSGNHADFLRKDYQTYIELRYSLSYRTELVGSHLNSRDKWILPKQNS